MSDTRAPVQSAAGRVLEAILDAGGPIAKSIRKRWNRTVLWRYVTGRDMPTIPIASEFRDMTGGCIPVEAWAVGAKKRRAAPDADEEAVPA